MKWSILAARQSHEEAAELKDGLRHEMTPLQLALAKRMVSDFALKAATNSPNR